MLCFTGGTLVQNICSERRTALQDELAHWMSWRNLLPLTSRDEAERQGKGKKNRETMRWSIWSSVDILPTAMVHLSIITMMKMSLETAATVRIIPDETRKTDIS